MFGHMERRSSPRVPRNAKVAVAGVLLTALALAWLSWQSFHALHASPPAPGIAAGTCRGSTEMATFLNSQIRSFSASNTDLENQAINLRKMIRQAEQRRLEVEAKISSISKNPGPKAGPFGAVKAPRSPTIEPNRSVNPMLAELLNKVTVNNELMVTLANSNVRDMVRLWHANVKRVGVSNYVVVALDEGVERMCVAEGVNVYRPRGDGMVEGIGRNGSNHMVSGLKFRVLREFLEMGYGVLLSDADVVVLKNPFEHLYRDSDVEAMSDGHTNQTAYGYNDVFGDENTGWDSMRIWVYNSGFFYIRPTLPSIELLDRVAARLERDPKAWDQAVFNEELFFPSHPGYVGLHASKRTMDMYDFMNSKVLFRYLRHDGRMFLRVRPVVVHINSHPEKMERMRAVMEFYVEGKKDAFKMFHDGSGMDLESSI